MKTILFITIFIFICNLQISQNFDIQLFKKTFQHKSQKLSSQLNFEEFQKLFFKKLTPSDNSPNNLQKAQIQPQVRLTFDIEAFKKAFTRKVEKTQTKQRHKLNEENSRLNFQKFLSFNQNNLQNAPLKNQNQNTLVMAQLNNFLSQNRFDYDKFRKVFRLFQKNTIKKESIVQQPVSSGPSDTQQPQKYQTKGAVVIIDSVPLSQNRNIRKN